jgi:hypothetical protein
MHRSWDVPFLLFTGMVSVSGYKEQEDESGTNVRVKNNNKGNVLF